MRASLKAIVVCILVLLAATMPSSIVQPFANRSDAPVVQPQLALVAQPAAGPASHNRATLARGGCDDMRPSSVAWYVLTGDGEVDRRVDAYPSGAREIVAGFEYECVPANTIIVTVFTHDGEVVLTDEESLGASAEAGLYSYPLVAEDGTPLADGEWQVSFSTSRQRLVSGGVRVGGAQMPNTTLLRGMVRDNSARKPVRGALVAIIKPGVTVGSFLDSGRESDLYASATTDSLGQFTLSRPLARGVAYGLLVVAKGYRPLAQDDFSIAAGEPTSLSIDILLVK
jgi:hypothetical protein